MLPARWVWPDAPVPWTPARAVASARRPSSCYPAAVTRGWHCCCSGCQDVRRGRRRQPVAPGSTTSPRSWPLPWPGADICVCLCACLFSWDQAACGRARTTAAAWRRCCCCCCWACCWDERRKMRVILYIEANERGAVSERVVCWESRSRLHGALRRAAPFVHRLLFLPASALSLYISATSSSSSRHLANSSTYRYTYNEARSFFCLRALSLSRPVCL